MSTTATTLMELDREHALDHLKNGAALVDLRAVDEYARRHVRGSISLLYEFGPGMAARARDCLPLDVPLILLRADVNMSNAAAALRGKGFSVLGVAESDIDTWSEWGPGPATSPIVERDSQPEGFLLDVGDPRRVAHAQATVVPIERLYASAGELASKPRITVLAGAGVRAALAVGVLERAGVREVSLWRKPR